jgi:polysaccharide biosynthesis protein PslH
LQVSATHAEWALILKILWIKTEFLHPVDKGGKIRTYNMLRELKRDHEITYLTLDDGSADQSARESANEYCQEWISIPHSQREKFSVGFYAELASNLFATAPYAVQKYYSRKMYDRIRELVAERNYDVLVCDFLAPALNVPENLPCPAILFQHNVEAIIWKRHYEVQQQPLKKAYLKTQWRKMVKFEQQACLRFDSVISVSREDSETMQNDYGIAKVFDVPTGVDTEFFQPTEKIQSDPMNLVFTGSMDWLPNEDGIRYFTERVMPKVRATLPNVTLTVVGRNPYPSLVELSKRDPSIIVTGRVDDVRPYMEKASAYVVPLRVGGGTRLKIYEAMAMEKPIISTSIGAEGLPLTDGEHLLLADTPEKFAEAVVRVLSEPALAKKLSSKAATEVREKFAWSKVAQSFAALCEQAVQQYGAAAMPTTSRLSVKAEAS